MQHPRLALDPCPAWHRYHTFVARKTVPSRPQATMRGSTTTTSSSFLLVVSCSPPGSLGGLTPVYPTKPSFSAPFRIPSRTRLLPGFATRAPCRYLLPLYRYLIRTHRCFDSKISIQGRKFRGGPEPSRVEDDVDASGAIANRFTSPRCACCLVSHWLGRPNAWLSPWTKRVPMRRCSGRRGATSARPGCRGGIGTWRWEPVKTASTSDASPQKTISLAWKSA